MLENQNGRIPGTEFFAIILGAVVFFSLLGWGLDSLQRFILLPRQPTSIPQFSFVAYYNQMFTGWPFWLGVCLLFVLLFIPSFMRGDEKPEL